MSRLTVSISTPGALLPPGQLPTITRVSGTPTMAVYSISSGAFAGDQLVLRGSGMTWPLTLTPLLPNGGTITSMELRPRRPSCRPSASRCPISSASAQVPSPPRRARPTGSTRC